MFKTLTMCRQCGEVGRFTLERKISVEFAECG